MIIDKVLSFLVHQLLLDFDYQQSSVEFWVRKFLLDFETYNYRTIIVEFFWFKIFAWFRNTQLSRVNLIGLQVYRGYEPCGSVNPKHRKQGKPWIYLRYTCNCVVIFCNTGFRFEGLNEISATLFTMTEVLKFCWILVKNFCLILKKNRVCSHVVSIDFLWS